MTISNQNKKIENLLSIQSRWARIGIITLMMGVCVLLDILLYPRVGVVSGMVMVVPVVTTAWYFGMRAAIPVVLLGTLSNMVAGSLAGNNEWESYLILTNLTGAIPAAMAGYIVARLRTLTRVQQREAIEHEKSNEERRSYVEFLATLNDIVRAALEANDLQTLLKMLADRTGPLFSADDCFITLWDETNKVAIPKAAYGPMSQEYAGVQARPGQHTLTSSVLEAGHVLIVDNAAHNPYVDPDVAEPFPALVSVLGLPLISGERKLGAFLLGYRRRRQFNQQEIERAEMAARQISLAMMKVILLDEAQQRVNELAGLHALSQTFNLYDDIHRIFGLLTEIVGGLLGAKMCAVVMLDSTGTEFRGQPSCFGLTDEQITMFSCPADVAAAIWKNAENNIFMANSVNAIPEVFLPFQQSFKVENVLATPLWNNTRDFVGVLIAANKAGGFNGEDVRLMEIFASQAAVVIENTRLLSAERRSAEELSVLHKISIAATEAKDENELIERTMVLISERLYPDNFGILLMDENREELYLHSSYWLGERFKPVRIPVSTGISGSVARSGKSRCVNDVSLAPDYIVMDERTQSELCAPLKIGEHVIGVINAESSRINAFTREDENLMATMAGQIAIAIQRLRTSDVERHQTSQLIRSNALIRILADVGARAAAAPDPEGVMSILGNELVKIGMICLVALPRDSRHVTVVYTSAPKRVIKFIERTVKRPISDIPIPYERLMVYSGRDPRPELLVDPVAVASSILVDFPLKAVNRFLHLLGVSGEMPLCHLPLMVEGKLHGVLWLWGEGLRESDLPTLTIFANQVAIALQNARLMAEVHRLATTDEGTGIFNRRHFFQLAEQEFSRTRRYKHPLSAIIVDVDEFKAFNDHYGHIVGDQVLRQVAQALKNNLREGDILGRYGGEEFSILLPSTEIESARKVAERLCEQVAAAGVRTEKEMLSVTVSIGVAELKPEMSNLLALVEIADQAMYAAKEEGGNRAFVK
jgi:diguanylate cyclase (GGDEF)-like protein